MTQIDNPQAWLGKLANSQLMRRGLHLWYLRMLQNRQDYPAPKDLPSFSTGANPWRVLLFGNGAAYGWGVFSHKFSLTGQLAYAMHEQCGKPVHVDYVGEEMMNAQTAGNWLGDRDLTQYDQIIVTMGWNDAVRLTPTHIWQQAMTQLLDDMQQRKHPRAKMLLTGIEPLNTASGYEGLVGQLAQHAANKMNGFLQSYAAAHESVFIPLGLPAVDPLRPHGSMSGYRARADEIAAVAAQHLPAGKPRDVQPMDTTFNWVGAKHILGLTPMGKGSAVFAALEKEAKETFSVELAQISILDGDRQWMVNRSGSVPASVPRELTYCDVTSQQDEPLLIPNGKKDDRFKDNPYLNQSGLPFYVGQPLYSRTGAVVGTFCLLAAVPRSKTLFRMKKFQALAERAQKELWRIEDEAYDLQ